jgi:predicted nucleic acid-binding protein
MPLVIDASIVLSWALEDEREAVPEETLNQVRGEECHVPQLWWFEVRNALLVNERRRRISERDVGIFLADVRTLRIVVDSATNEDGIFHLARHHHLTFYDAAYLELARRRRLPLATLDGQLADAARAENVPLVRG